MRRLSLAAFFTFASIFSACQPEKVEPVLQLTPSPRNIDGAGQVATIRLYALDDAGKAGTGVVQVTSSLGSLKDGADVTLTDGAATMTFECDRATDATCVGRVDLEAKWLLNGKLVTASSFVTIANPPPPDGGVSVTSSRLTMGVGLGQRSDLTATYYVDGAPRAGELINFTTSLGAIQAADGTPFATGTTDVAGQVRAYLVETGVAGTATITANAPMGKTATTTVNIYMPDAGISITSDRQVVTVGFDEYATIQVNHTLDGRAVAGRSIELDTSAGVLRALDGGAFVSPAFTDGNGRIEARLTDIGVPGIATVTASDITFNKSATTMVQLARPDAGVSVTTDRTRIYVGVESSALVTARLVTNGNPAVNRPLGVSTSVGVLSYPDGGAFTSPGTTDNMGALRLRLDDDGTEGTAVVTATDPDTARTGSANVTIVRVGTINYTSTTCGGTACTLMGVANSGFNTQASVRFTVRDAATPPQPVSGVLVTFALNNAPTGTMMSSSFGTTDAQGNVDVVVSSGNSIGSFNITAQVLPGISASSPTIGVRGAKATNAGMALQCAKVNLPVYRSNSVPADITTNCNITLIDRNNNPIGNGTTVQLNSEAGNITSSVTTTAYTPNGTNEGRGVAPFRSNTPFPAEDVTPLAANAGQYPFALVQEPSRMDGALVRNPRDALVAILAYTDGEEWFADTNGDGVQNGSEQFYDQGEPFVDNNDNDICDGTEFYVDVDQNGAWTPPNGVWNANTKVWTKAYVLYTDAVSVGVATPDPFNVPKGTTVGIDYFGLDLNLNTTESASVLATSRTGSRGTFTFVPTVFQDGFGFGLAPRQLTNAAGTGPCGSTTPICVYKTIFSTWSNGKVGTIQFTGVPTTDMTAGQAVTATVRVTTVGLPVDITANGFVQ